MITITEDNKKELAQSIADAVKSICSDIRTEKEAEANLKRAEAIRILLEVSGIWQWT